MNHKRTILISLLVLAGLTLAACSAPVAAPAGSTQEHTISVSGSGSASAAPDIATVQLGVEVTDPDVDAAVEQVNTTMTDVQAALQDAGVAAEDIQTRDFSVRQDHREPRPEDDQPTESVYVVRNIVQVKVRDMDSISDVIAAGLDAGANNVHSLDFSIEDTSELEAEARAGAIEEARSRADQLASELGVSVGQPVQVSEGGGGQPVFREEVAMDAAAASGGPAISQGELTVSVTVNVSYAIED